MIDPETASSATLLYLFADAEIPADTAMTRAVKVPCTHAAVQRKALGIELIAITIWSLKEQGALTIRHEARKRRLFGSRDVALIAAISAIPPSTSALAVSIFQACEAEEAEVSAAVYKWYGSDVADPVEPILREVEGEAAGLGLFEPPLRRPILGSKLGDPHCERIAAQRPAFDRLIRAWRHFKTAEPGLYRALTSGIRTGMNARVEAADFFD